MLRNQVWARQCELCNNGKFFTYSLKMDTTENAQKKVTKCLEYFHEFQETPSALVLHWNRVSDSANYPRSSHLETFYEDDKGWPVLLEPERFVTATSVVVRCSARWRLIVLQLSARWRRICGAGRAGGELFWTWSPPSSGRRGARTCTRWAVLYITPSPPPLHFYTLVLYGGEKRVPEPIVLVIFNIKSARYLVLFAGKSTR